jgi:hypothetical protein
MTSKLRIGYPEDRCQITDRSDQNEPVVGKNVIGWGRAGRRVFRAGVVRSSNGGPSGEGAERMFASRRESTRSTPPVGPAILDP